MTEQKQANLLMTMNNWERALTSAGMDWLVGTANSLHTIVGLRLRQTAIDIWCVGRVLAREKELVGHGNWINHCRRFHPEISLDSIERYMRVGQIPIDQLPALLDKTPQQAYAMLDLARKRSALPVQPAKQDRSRVNSAHMRNFEQGLIIALFECPYCDKKIEFSTEGTCGIARRA